MDPQILYYISEALGATGVILILLSYWMLQNDKFTRDLLAYSVMNLIGALLVLFSLYFKPNISAIIIEIAWAIMSAIAIVKAKRERAKKKQKSFLTISD